jgi:hypothetical protein
MRNKEARLSRGKPGLGGEHVYSMQPLMSILTLPWQAIHALPLTVIARQSAKSLDSCDRGKKR